MDKARKTRLKRIIAAVCAVAVVALLAAMPLIAGNETGSDGPQASILSGTAQTGSVDTKLLGGGVLTEGDGMTVSLPASVKLTKFLVSNGQMVSEGDAIANVDRVSVMTAISEVQETLDYLAEQIVTEMEADTDDTVTALVGGKVKILYGEKGESVQDVMLEHGALAVLSLDGLMAVNLTVEETVAVGASVTVTLSDGTKADGKVVSSLAGDMTITVEDDDYPVGDSVKVTTEDGTKLGSGALYIYSPWNATAYTGTISAVKVSEGKTVKTGNTLMTLSDVGYTAAYRQLVAQRQAYEDLMLELFTMYQTEQITAPCDGVVSGVDENSIQLLSNTKRFAISLLANVPRGDDGKTYTNFAAKVISFENGVWNLMVDPMAVDVTDYKKLHPASIDTANMTQEGILSADIPVYSLEKGQWLQIDTESVNTGDILLFAFDDSSNAVWAVQIVAAPATEETEPPTEPEETTEPEEPTEVPTEPSETEPPMEEPSEAPTMPPEIEPPTEPEETTEPEDPTEAPTEPSEPPTEPDQPTEPEQSIDPTAPTEPQEPMNPTDPGMPEDPTMPTEPGMPENPSDSTEPVKPEDSTIPTQPSGSDIPSNPGGNFPSGGGNWGNMSGVGGMGGTGNTGNTGNSGNTGSMGNTGGMGGSNISGMTGMNGDFMMEQDPETELYGMDMAQIAAVIPQDTMTVEITVDELDIRALKIGMKAEVKINALGGEKFAAAITSISNTGTNNGGSSKFTVELTMDRQENILVGMNATANLVLNTTANMLLVPADALVEAGTRTLVYTGYDEENECLTGPVEVTTGVSDGNSVQILEGLSDGDTYYYAYYDTLEISYTPDFGGGMMFGR